MRLATIPNQRFVDAYLTRLCVAQRAEGQVSGQLVKLRCLQESIKQLVGATKTNGKA